MTLFIIVFGGVGMSDLLVVRGIDASAARLALDEWALSRQWVKSVDLRDRWESQELEINSRNAIAFVRGKHRAELMALVELLRAHQAQVVHVMWRRSGSKREEQVL